MSRPYVNGYQASVVAIAESAQPEHPRYSFCLTFKTRAVYHHYLQVRYVPVTDHAPSSSNRSSPEPRLIGSCIVPTLIGSASPEESPNSPLSPYPRPHTPYLVPGYHHASLFRVLQCIDSAAVFTGDLKHDQVTRTSARKNFTLPISTSPSMTTLPVLFVSHGSPMLCAKPSDSSRWWQEVSTVLPL